MGLDGDGHYRSETDFEKTVKNKMYELRRLREEECLKRKTQLAVEVEKNIAWMRQNSESFGKYFGELVSGCLSGSDAGLGIGFMEGEGGRRWVMNVTRAGDIRITFGGQAFFLGDKAVPQHINQYFTSLLKQLTKPDTALDFFFSKWAPK